MMKVTIWAVALSLAAFSASAQAQQKTELARELIEARPFQVWVDRMIFVSKQRALLPYTGSDLRPDQLEIIRGVSVGEWSNARDEVLTLYVEALAQSYSADALKKLIAFYADEELQTALAMGASAQSLATDAYIALTPEVEARIKTRLTTELED